MRALFLGEGELSGPARYLASVLHWTKIPFDHRPDQAKIPKAWRRSGRYQAVILSDYRYAAFTRCSREWLAQEVREIGTGLLMIGGWASFTGLVGGYAGTAIEKLLPVRCIPGDDRVNCASLVSIDDCRFTIDDSKSFGRNFQSSILNRQSSMPLVCGYHRAIPKPDSRTVLSLRDLHFKNGRPLLGKPHPLLVLGAAGKARTAAFLTDCAPHWAGGLVDWGRRRVTVKLRSAISTEVGETNLRFFARLIRWVAGAHEM